MALPPRIKLCKSWTLLYSLDAHGTSLTTLYTRVQAGLQKSTGGCVLVVKDMEGGIFGAYVNEAFKKSESYYGNGEWYVNAFCRSPSLKSDLGLNFISFLWKVEAFPPGDNFRVGPIVRSFRWTARNDYIILSDSNFLSVGGGYVQSLSFGSPTVLLLTADLGHLILCSQRRQIRLMARFIIRQGIHHFMSCFRK